MHIYVHSQGYIQQQQNAKTTEKEANPLQYVLHIYMHTIYIYIYR